MKYKYIINDLCKVAGILIVLLVIFSGNLKSIFYWHTPELIGYNGITLVTLFLGIYLIRKGRKAKKTRN